MPPGGPVPGCRSCALWAPRHCSKRRSPTQPSVDCAFDYGRICHVRAVCVSHDLRRQLVGNFSGRVDSWTWWSWESDEKKGPKTNWGGYATFCISTEVLMREFAGRANDSGQIVTNVAIPFSELKGGRVQNRHNTWSTLVVPTGEDQFVLTYTPSRPTSKSSSEKFLGVTKEVVTLRT